MISYDRYKDKIAKLAAVKNFVVRFRALFIVAFALITALVTAFLATKGIVTSDISILQADILYGDTYEIKPAKALFSSVRYEYAHEDSEDWSAEKPDKAGKYRVRTVTSKAFGVGYGKTLSFEIAPRPTEIAIAQSSIVYGDDPNNFTCTLVNGDKLSVVGFRFDSFATDISNVCANADSVVITNRAGENVTYCYSLSTPTKQVKLNPKSVSFVPKAAEYVYNGAPFAYESGLDEASQKQLAAGDVITVASEIIAPNGETVAAPENAGVYTVKITDLKIMNGDTDVTALYDWESGLKTAKLSVARREVTVQTASDSKEYDATPLVNANFTADNLADGHTFIVEQSASRKVVGSSFNEITAYKIQAGVGEEVTDNYAVTIAAGTLTITPREIIIKTAGAQKAYDGKPLSNENFTMNPSPIKGHVFEVYRTLPEITEVGTILNVLSVRATDEEGNFVTENYAVGYTYGDLVITEQELTYTTETITHIYDGTAVLSAGTVTGGLAEGERVEIDVAASAKQTLAGETDNAPVFRVYRIADGRETTENYAPTLQGERGKLIVEKRKVTVRTHTPDEAFEYDGGDHVWPLADVFLAGTEESGLADGQVYMAVIGAEGTIRNVGSQENNFTVEFLEGDTEVTENYEVIKYEYGTLTVYKRTLSITTGTKTDVEYDGTPFTYTEGWSADNLAKFQTLEADTTKPIASVTEVLEQPLANEVTYLVRDEEGNDVTDNYDIQNYTYGVINRTPRAVSLATKFASTPYDGKPMQCLEWENVERLLTEHNHQIALDMTKKDSFASITYGYDEEGNQLFKINVLYFIVLDGDGNDISYNYSLEVAYGTLTRSKCAMTVHTLSAEKVYDGHYLYGDDEGEFMTEEPVFDGLVEGELYETNSTPYALNVKYEEREAVPVKNDTIYDFFTSDKSFKTTHNYQITTEMGDLLITPRPLSIRTSTVTKEYDGKWLYGTEEGEGELGATQVTGLADNQGIVVSSVVTIRDVLWKKDDATAVDGIENTTRYKVVAFQMGEDTTNNYTITYTYGTLTITPKVLTITTLSAEKEYDGEPLDGSVEGDWENGKPTFDGLVAGELYTPFIVTTMTDVLRGTNGEVLTRYNLTKYYFYAQEDGEERNTTKNYTLRFVLGTLKILPREIKYTTPTATHEYDGEEFYAYASNYACDRLVSGHRLVPVTDRENPYSTITEVRIENGEVASIPNEVYYRVVDANGDDITANYDITERTWGTLTVTPRRLRVATNSSLNTWIYADVDYFDDGYKAYHMYSDSDINGDGAFTFVSGHTLETVTKTVLHDVTIGYVHNDCTYKVMNGDTDVSYNYELRIVPGLCNVRPRPITITSGSQAWTYDGQAHNKLDGFTWTELTERTGLVSGHTVAVDTTANVPTITHFRENEKENNVLTFKIMKGETDVTANYYVTTEYGTIAIEKAAITVALTPFTHVKYNGLAVTYPTGKNNYTVASSTALQNGEELQVAVYFTKEQAGTGEKVTPVLAGTYYAHLDYENCRVFAGSVETDATDYAITAQPVELVITENNLTVTTQTGSSVYNGNPYTLPAFTDETIASLPAGHTIAVDASKPIASVTEVNEGEVENVFSYIVYDGAGKDVTKSFLITEVWGKISVTQRTVTVVTASDTHEYDGKAFSYPHWEANPAGLLASEHGHYLEWDSAKPTASVLTVYDGEKTNTFSVVVKDASGKDISYNYKIEYQNDGKIQVTPRQIQITVNSAEKDYDGTKLVEKGATAVHFKNGVADSEVALLGGDKLVATSEEISITNAYDNGTGINIYDYIVKNGENDVSNNYQILNVTAGDLKINQLPLSLRLTALNNTVYGDPVPVYPTGTGNYEAISKSLPNGELLEVVVYFTLNAVRTELGEAGTYEIILDADNSKIYKDGAVKNEGIKNYSFSWWRATVTIEKRQVELSIKQLENATKVYDGEQFIYVTAFGKDEVCYTARALNTTGAFAPGEWLLVELSVVGKNGHTVLQHADEYTVRISDASRVVKPIVEGTRSPLTVTSENYTLTVTSDTASYEITKRPLTVTLVDDGREYDGTKYSYGFKSPDDADYEVEGLLSGTTLSGNFVFSGDGITAEEKQPENAGVYTVTFQTAAGTWSVSSSRFEPCKTSDYEITTVTDATIIISKRKISVSVNTWREQYKAEIFFFTDVHYTSSHVGFAGESGFVNSDDAGNYSYEFKQNGAVVAPRNVGYYTVTVSFFGLSENYDITSTTAGTFTIDKRKVTVFGSHKYFVYAASVMDNDFSFSSHQTGNPDGEGFLGTDADAFNATYTVKYNGNIFAHETEIIHGGSYDISVRLAVKAGQSAIADNYSIIYETGGFTVTPRPINATRDEAFTKVYDKVEISTAGWNFFDWVDERGDTANGFLLASERANAIPTFAIYQGGAPVSPINAGVYTIRISGFTSADNSGLIERDYTVKGGEETLTIEKFLLIIKPVDYTGLNTGADIALPASNVATYTANEAGDGIVACSLLAGDSITVTGDAVLKPGSKYMQAVYIASYTLHGDDGVADNYRVIYKYDTNNAEEAELLKKLGVGMKVFFRGNLTCETLTVEIKQILKNDKHKTIVTDGSKYNIPLEDVGFEVVAYADRSSSVTVAENQYGLLEGHFAKVTAASVRQYPGVYQTWLTVKIYRIEDGKEVDVSKGYNILYQDDESSYITVKAISLSFDILVDAGALVNEDGDALQDGDVVYRMDEDGNPVALQLDQDFKITEGKLLGKHQVEFKVVVEGGVLVGLKPGVYTEHSSGAHISQETYYDVQNVSIAP
ncbi:MAG: hypothetical protein K2N84_02885 [Clostridia bacterium]|nr:hypothetical protein [Clostridia bacterium]